MEFFLGIILVRRIDFDKSLQSWIVETNAAVHKPLVIYSDGFKVCRCSWHEMKPFAGKTLSRMNTMIKDRSMNWWLCNIDVKLYFLLTA